LSPKKTKVNEILPPFCQLAERTIGEDIAIEMKLAANLWLTRVDPGELENAFLNLTVNARDAMPNGGQLIFETKNHVQKTRDEQISDAPPPGSFVLISVRDTGAGMSAKVREQAFEPYFTTKDIGEGSGLGLSMVFGFAKQSGGHVSISSEEGRGTAVNIFLPKAEDKMPASNSNSETRSQAPMGDETVLIVEDATDVREFLAIALSRLGYGVLVAEDGPKAMKIMADSEQIDLLLTDVILPHGMNGRDVAEAFSVRYPSAGVLYSSGYTRDVLDGRVQLDKDVPIINKPYRPFELAKRVREILDRGK
ncbi:MAG: response regulator, partial [Rhodospirillaceae bacterium]|nr:response regulator [Rhodospirillaceae bacterium]